MTKTSLNHNHSYYQQIQNIICCKYLKNKTKMVKTLLNLRRLSKRNSSNRASKNTSILNYIDHNRIKKNFKF